MHLKCPADDLAGLAQSDNQCCENQEAHEHPGEVLQTGIAGRRRLLAGHLRHAQRLEAQYRQHTGHQVKNQAAQNREADGLP